MNRLKKILLSYRLPKPPFSGFRSDRYSSGKMVDPNVNLETGLFDRQEIKSEPTKKHKPNKSLSHTIQFTSHLLPWLRVYSSLSGKNGFCYWHLVSHCEVIRC